MVMLIYRRVDIPYSGWMNDGPLQLIKDLHGWQLLLDLLKVTLNGGGIYVYIYIIIFQSCVCVMEDWVVFFSPPHFTPPIAPGICNQYSQRWQQHGSIPPQTNNHTHTHTDTHAEEETRQQPLKEKKRKEKEKENSDERCCNHRGSHIYIFTWCSWAFLRWSVETGKKTATAVPRLGRHQQHFQ